ncbi:MAG: MurR/RpiR family transcriptional regulator [Desulfohalobiaceae bacterium]
MCSNQKHPLFVRLQKLSPKLTAKGRILNSYIQENPGQVVFMTIKDLARATGMSEATVFRFVRSLGYSGYNEFLQELRDVLDTSTPALARLDLAASATDADTLLHALVSGGMRNLQHFYKHVDIQAQEENSEQNWRTLRMYSSLAPGSPIFLSTSWAGPWPRSAAASIS